MSQFLVNSVPEWEPRDFQKEGVRLVLSNAGAGLFFDPGLGKTSTTLAAASILLGKGIVSKILVVAPLRVCYNVWPAEGAKWQEFNHLRFAVLHGKDKDKVLRQDDYDIGVINPEGLQWLWSSRNDKFARKFTMLVVDESTKFKRPQSKRWKLLKKYMGQFDRRYILTGTPAPNGLTNLFGQVYIIDAGARLGKYVTHFRREYCTQSYDGHSWEIRSEEAAQKIYDKIADVCMRLDARDYIDMPDLWFDDIKVTLPDKASVQYKELERQFVLSTDEHEITALNAASLYIKLQQIANGRVYGEANQRDSIGYAEIHDEKIAALVDLVDQLEGKPLLCFYAFNHELEAIQKVLPQAQHIGKNKSQQQGSILQSAFNEGIIPILLAHPASAGHGLNLQGACSHVAFFGMTWDLELYDQGFRRVWRQGQDASRVVVHRIIAKGTIDELMVKALQKKAGVQDALFDALKAHLTQLRNQINGT